MGGQTNRVGKNRAAGAESKSSQGQYQAGRGGTGTAGRRQSQGQKLKSATGVQELAEPTSQVWIWKYTKSGQ